jgi:hypothetical protein
MGEAPPFTRQPRRQHRRGQLDPPQSPSGSVTGQAATFNYAETITSTEEFLQAVLIVDKTQQGLPALNAAPVIAGCSSVAFANWYAGNPETSTTG